MIIGLYIVAAVIMAVGSLYLAWQNREFRKFLAGAFFVSSGILFYLYLGRCFSASVGNKFCRNASDQRWPLHRSFHPLLALFLFWLRQEGNILKRASSHGDVRFGSKADILRCSSDVRFTPESRHVRCTSPCLLCANSG